MFAYATVALCLPAALALTYMSSPYNKEYMFHGDAMNWNNSQKFCSEHGGLLVKLQSNSEQMWVMQNVAKSRVFWLGGISTTNARGRHA